MASVPVMFQIGEELLAQLDEWAAQNDMSRSRAIREAIAALVGAENGSLNTVRRRKYENDEIRQQLQVERNKQRRQARAIIVEGVKLGYTRDEIIRAGKQLGFDLEQMGLI